MARIRESMRDQVAGSVADRFTVNHEATASPARSAVERQAEGRKRLDAACVIRVDRIAPDPAQPRAEFDEEPLAQLAASIRDRGQLQPIRVRWDADADRYVIVVGERRYRAARLAGLDTVACVVVVGEPSAEDLLEDQLVENALRVDLKPIEQARAYRSLLAARGLSHRQLAERLQIGHASIARALALLDLPPQIRDAVEQGVIAPNTGYELSKVTDPAEQATLAKEAAEGRLRRDELKARTTARRPAKAPAKGKQAAPKPPTGRTFRVDGGRVTVENPGGVDAAWVRAALTEVLSQLDGAVTED